MNRGEILETAAGYVTKDREQTYGKPENNFNLVADLWATYLNANRPGVFMHITAEDVAMMMTLLKIARIRTGKPKADNYVDACGYMACGGEIATKLTED